MAYQPIEDYGIIGDLHSAAGLLQAASLPFIVAATEIGMVVLLSVVLLPLAALTILRGGKPAAPGGLDRFDPVGHEPRERLEALESWDRLRFAK